MFSKIKIDTIKSLFTTQNLGLYVVAIIALSVAWSSVRIIQKNYNIQKRITVLEQEVAVLEQQTKNQKLKNQYFKTDTYLDLAARKYFSKAAPGEKLLIVPAEVAATYIHPPSSKEVTKTRVNPGSKIMNNLRAWQAFLSHNER
jgi:cell division protein FtsB